MFLVRYVKYLVQFYHFHPSKGGQLFPVKRNSSSSNSFTSFQKGILRFPSSTSSQEEMQIFQVFPDQLETARARTIAEIDENVDARSRTTSDGYNPVIGHPASRCPALDRSFRVKVKTEVSYHHVSSTHGILFLSLLGAVPECAKYTRPSTRERERENIQNSS